MPGAGPEVGPLAHGGADGIAQATLFSRVGIQLREEVALARFCDVVSQRACPLPIAPLDAPLLVQEHQHHGNVVHDPLQQLALLAPRVLDALALDGHRHLRGDEREDVALAFAVAHALRIGLRHHDADGAVLHLERDAEPVDGGRADQLRLARRDEVLVDLGRREQRPAGAQHVLRQSLAQLARRDVAGGVVLVDEVGKLQPVVFRIVERDVEILRFRGWRPAAPAGCPPCVPCGRCGTPLPARTPRGAAP